MPKIFSVGDLDFRYFYNQGDYDEQIEFQSVKLTTNLEEIYSRVRFEE